MSTQQHAALRSSLTAAREAAGLTQSQLARLLKRPISFVAGYEQGRREVCVQEFWEIVHCLHADVQEVLRPVLAA